MEGLWIAKVITDTAVAPLSPRGGHFGKRGGKVALGAKANGKGQTRGRGVMDCRVLIFFFKLNVRYIAEKEPILFLAENRCLSQQ